MKTADFFFKLTDLTERITDGSHNPPKGIGHSSFLMLSSRNVFNDEINTEKVRYLTEEDFEIENRRTDLKDLDVLLTIVGTIGRSAVFNKELGNIVLQRSVAVLRPIQSKINSRFLMYNLQSKLSTMLSESRGVAQQGFYLDQLRNLIIYAPPLIVQQEIVEKLDSAFAKIDSLEKNLQLKEEKTNQLLQSMLSAAFTNTEKFDVKVVKLESIVDILDNLRQPINSTERSGRIGKIPYYGATGQVGTIDRSIFNENLLLLGEDGVPFFDHNKHKAYEISGPSWVNNHAHVLRAKTSHVIQKYLLYFLNNFNYSGYVNGATRLKLTQGDMKRIPVPLPTLVNQEIIVGKLDKAYDEVQKLRNQFFNEKELISSLRQSILSNAFKFEEKAA
jgi:restriction endonuclease S subunit